MSVRLFCQLLLCINVCLILACVNRNDNDRRTETFNHICLNTYRWIDRLSDEYTEPEGASQNRSSALKYCLKSASNINKVCTMSSLISNKLLTEMGLIGHYAVAALS